MIDHRPFVLASASPRRRELLRQVGIECEMQPAALDEAPHPGEAPRAYVLRLACAKAEAVAAARGDALPVLGADTEVVVDGEVLGKPADAAAAHRMLRRLSGRTHEVISAVALATVGASTRSRVSTTRVTLRPVEDWEIAAYCATAEPYDKAGGYAVQGRAAAFISRLDGSYSGTVGLPLFETLELLAAAGLASWR